MSDAMEHDYVKDLLSAYFDQELTPEQTALAAGHLQTCQDCRAELEKLGQLERLVKEKSGLSEDSDYWEKAAQKIEARLDSETLVTEISPKSKRQSSGPGWRWVAVAASVVFLTWVGINRDLLLPVEEEGQTEIPSVKEKPTQLQMESETESEPAGRTDDDKEAATSSDERKSELRQVPSQGDRATETAREEAVNNSPVTDVQSVPTPRKKAPPPPPSPSGEIDEAILRRSGTEITAGLKDADSFDEVGAEQNYRNDESEVAGKVKLEASDVVGQSAQLVEDSTRLYGASETDKLIARELTYWRGQIDSLTLALHQSPDTVQDLSRAKLDKFSAIDRTKSGASGLLPQTLPEPKSEAELDKIEADLARAWYEYCLLSSDSTETGRGVEFLRTVANNQKSVNRTLADEYLAKLGRK